MRILLVNKYWRKQGGVEEYCFLLKEVLEGLGHEVVPFAQRESATFDNDYISYFPSEVNPATTDPVGRIRAARRAIYGGDAKKSLAKLLDEHQIDVAHVVHLYHQLGPALVQEFKRRKIPMLLSVHDYKLSCPSYRLLDDSTGQICTICLDEPRRRVTAPTETRCWRGSRAAGLVLGAEALSVKALKPYQYASSVLVSNELMRRSAISGGVAPDRIQTVPNFWPEARDPQFPPAKGDHVLFVGRLVAEKGVDVLVRASALSGVPVKIIGVGPLEDELKRLASELDAPVQFLGQQWGTGVEQAMREAKALVVPSIWHEVSPLVIYQAMTLGTPVIGSDVGGIPDLLGDGRGTLVAPRDIADLATVLSCLGEDPGPFETMAVAAQTYSSTNLSRAKFEARLRRAYLEAGIEL
jgi:glycosyltransferase involved in cell wall biosynthesis